jgi:glutamate racemase
MDGKSLGIFDSGLGGLTAVKEIIKILPNEDLVYLGDTARVPYGTRSKGTIIKFSFEDANFLLRKNVKCIVIACNTASALAGKKLKKKLKIPVFEVVTPALKCAKKISKIGRIGVIGTRGTIDSGAYSVPFSKACSLFVPFIEEGRINDKALKLVARDYLSDLKKEKIDTLIMGCTHYPIIESIIRKEIGSNINLVNPGFCVAKELKRFLTENKMLNNQRGMGQRSYFVTDYTEYFIKMAEMFLGEKLKGKIKRVSIGK